MSKTYYGLIEPNPEKLNETIKVVSVEISDERGRAVKEYDLEPANRYIGISFLHGYAWGYGGEGPKALAEAILFDYTGDVKNIRKYRNALITCEIQHFDHDKGFILDSDHIEAAMRFADRQQEELEREDRRPSISVFPVAPPSVASDGRSRPVGEGCLFRARISHMVHRRGRRPLGHYPSSGLIKLASLRCE